MASYTGVTWRRQGVFLSDVSNQIYEYVDFTQVTKIKLSSGYVLVDGVHSFFHCDNKTKLVTIQKITDQTNSSTQDVTIRSTFMTDFLNNWLEAKR